MDHCDAQLSRVVMRNYVLLMLLLPERIIIGDKKATFVFCFALRVLAFYAFCFENSVSNDLIFTHEQCGNSFNIAIACRRFALY